MCLSLWLFAGMMGCAHGPVTAAEMERRSFTEAEALGIVVGVLRDVGLAPERAWPVSIPGGVSLEADFRIEGSRFGVEWISPQDRSDIGDVLPGPNEDGRLRVIAASSDDNEAQILLLEHSSYLHHSELAERGSGGLSVREAENRLARDLRDFLTYAQGQGL